MIGPTAFPFARERNLVLSLLLALAAAAWVLLAWQAARMRTQPMGLTMGMGAFLFLAIWVVMMVAMMFPTAAPMVLMFTSVSGGKRRRGQAFVPTWVFVGAYLAVWTLFGALAYGAATGVERLGHQSMWLMDQAARFGGVALLAAGLYQLSPLKRVCLAKCRSPLAFIHSSWRDGYGGAVRMGLAHGLYCLGCCWLLFVILFPLGVMNVVVMALVTVLIFAEKACVFGRQVSWVAAVVLVAYGVIVIAMPRALPTTM